MNRAIIQLGRSRLILGFIIAVGVIFGYLSYPSPGELGTGLIEEPVGRRDDLKYFEGFVLDFSILDDERYKSLEIFGENPVDAGTTGERKNPFAPL